MAATDFLSSSSLRCELQVIGAKNVETKHKGSLFIRCYLPAGNNSRIKLNTPEITPSQNDDHLFWDEKFSLECNGTEDYVSKLEHESIVFELRWRKAKPFLGKIGGSQLIASVEMPWKTVFDAENMEIQKWVVMCVNNLTGDFGGKVLMVEEGVKPPALEIAIKVEINDSSMSMEDMMMKRRRRRLRRKEWDECGCSGNGGCCSCADTELLFVAAALEAF